MHETKLETRLFPKDGPSTGFSDVWGIAAFDDGSVLLTGSTEGSWSGDNLGEKDFAATKLSSSGDMEWKWQVIVPASSLKFPTPTLTSLR